MQVGQIRDLLSEMDENAEVFCLLYLREEANDWAEMEDITPPNDEEWIEIVRYMHTDDGIHEETSNSFVWALERMREKREKAK